MNKELSLYNLWCEKAVLDPELQAELLSIKGNDDAIKDRFYRDLEFGTGGLRGVIGAGTFRLNVYTIRRATQGLADYVNETYENPCMAIAHDSRINSDVFTKAAACVLAANGIKVYLYKELMPTPMLSFAVRYLKCNAGIVVTASHNPAKYNGYKVYGDDGCQMTLDAAEKVLEKDSKNVQAMQILLDEYIKKSDYAKAYSLSSRLMQIPSAQKTSLFSHIDICLALKKNTEAMNLALKAYEENPADENSCMAYVKVLSASGQKNSAMQLISSLLPSASQKMKSFLYFERSQIQGTEDSALADLRASLTANPRNKDSLYRLYEIYYAKKDWRRAQYYLKQVVALDPSNSLYLSKNSELEKLLGR